MILVIAWRNIWRNKLRSSFILSAIIIGLFGGIFIHGFISGMTIQAVQKSIDTQLSNIQIHSTEYLLDEKINYAIVDSLGIEKKILEIEGVEAISKRTKLSGILSGAEASYGVVVKGVDPKVEEAVTTLKDRRIAGSYLDTSFVIPIYVGRKLSEKLNVKLKSRVVLGIVKANGEVVYGAFKVCGIYSTNNNLLDGVEVYVNQTDLANLLEQPLETTFTEWAIKLKENKETQIIKDKIESLSHNANTLKVQTWEELDPTLKMQADVSEFFGAIFLVIILVAVLFGVINTMLMVVIERTHELGMLKAIGLKDRKLILMIVLETLLLASVGAVVGTVLGYLFIQWLSIDGINLSWFAQGLESIGLDRVIYPHITWQYILGAVCAVWIMALLASLFPARSIAKLKPYEAIRTQK